MKATRTALLATLLCLTAAASRAQTAPTNGGDIGLFTISKAESPRSGQLTLGFYVWTQQLEAGQLPSFDVPEKNRIYSHSAGEFSLGFGMTDHWSLFASGGMDRWKSRSGWEGGTINGVIFPSSFESNQASKVRVGSKYVFTSDAAPGLGVGIWVAAYIPVEGASTNSGDPTSNKINSSRADWEFGGVVSKDIFTGLLSYQISGQEAVRLPNIFRVAFGVDVPVIPDLHIIGEIDRNVLDGGDFPQPSYSMLSIGGRYWFGRSGLALSGAVNANLDLIAHSAFSPSPIGGIVGITYAAWPPPPPPPVIVPRPAPPTPAPVEEERAGAAPAPAPPAAPPPPQPKTTRDEIFFDGTSARLTNIAKAILDGIALRMKSDLNSTAAITGYTDNSGKEETNVAISIKRAEAAREYLVTRHGIDPNRISVSGKGSGDPAYDNATKEGRSKNRRAVIVVTFVSGA